MYTGETAAASKHKLNDQFTVMPVTVV